MYDSNAHNFVFCINIFMIGRPTMLELRHLRTLIALQETGSVSLAAERISHPIGAVASVEATGGLLSAALV
jgi:hypothetical protein